MGWWRSNRGKKVLHISGTPAQALAAYVRPQPRVFIDRPGMTKLPTGPRVSRISGPIYEGVNKKVKGPAARSEREAQRAIDRFEQVGQPRQDRRQKLPFSDAPAAGQG